MLLFLHPEFKLQLSGHENSVVENPSPSHASRFWQGTYMSLSFSACEVEATTLASWG